MRLRDELKDGAASLTNSAAFAGLVSLLERIDRPSPHAFTVLMYHRIDDPDNRMDLDPSLISVTPREFEQHVAYLAANRPVLSLDELLEVRRGNFQPPPSSVVMTFDDAYRDFAEHAWPVLRHYGVPATLFVPTAYPDHPERSFWWDRLYHALATTPRRHPLDSRVGSLKFADTLERKQAFRTMRDWVKQTPHGEAMAEVDRVTAELGVTAPAGAVLSWAELRQLASEGVTLAPHSQTHPMLNRLPVAEVEAEVNGSFRDLEREIGSAPPAFAFPSGGHGKEVEPVLAAAGFEIAFTVTRGSEDLRHVDWLRVRRVNVGRRANLSIVRAQLTSWPTRVGLVKRMLARF